MQKKTEEIPKPQEYPTIPIIEGAKILPYVYYPEGQSAVKAFKVHVSTLGIVREVTYNPTSAPEFDNIAGFKINEKLTVLRHWGRCAYLYPGHCYQLAEKFGGCIPTEAEFVEIAANLNDINASLASIDEKTLYKGHYLVLDNADVYCARVVNIEEHYVDFDDGCCFITVE